MQSFYASCYLFLCSFELISYFKKQFQSVLEEVKWDKANSFVDFTNDKKKQTEASISIWSHFISLNSKEILDVKGPWLMIKVTDQFTFWKQDSFFFKSFSATTKTNAPTNCCYNTSLGKYFLRFSISQPILVHLSVQPKMEYIIGKQTQAESCR